MFLAPHIGAHDEDVQSGSFAFRCSGGRLFQPAVKPFRLPEAHAKNRLGAEIAGREAQARIVRPRANPRFNRFVRFRQASESVKIAGSVNVKPPAERKHRGAHPFDGVRANSAVAKTDRRMDDRARVARAAEFFLVAATSDVRKGK